MITILFLLLMIDKEHAGKHWQDSKGHHYVTRDGREVGKDCNPCKEDPEPGYVAPVVPTKDFKCMAKDCTSPKKVQKKKK